MNNLNPVIIDNHSFFDIIAESKRKPNSVVLKSCSERVKLRYSHFEASKSELSTIINNQVWTNEESKSLTGCYKSTSKTSEIKAKVKAITQKCPYCDIGSVTPIDHYLPQSVFPEFSIYSLNLIPVCTDCNGNKLAKWHKTSHRKFINTYFDPVNEERFLHCKIVFEDNIPKANFYLKKIKNSNFEKVIISHFMELNLLKRYNEESNDLLSEMKINFNFCKTKELIVELLSNHIDSQKAKGQNHYKLALYEGMLNSEEFINFCLT